MRRQPKSTTPALQRFGRGGVLPILLACLCTLAGVPVHATVSLPNTPLQSGSAVPPNVMFILDDSGSMTETAMDTPLVNINNNASQNINSTAYTSNSLYYNPNTTYRPWRTATGAFMANASYGSASNDANLLTNAINLQSSDRDFHVPISSAAMGNTTDFYRYRFHTDGTASRCERTFVSGSWGWRNCLTGLTSFTWGAAPDQVTRDLAAEKLNFANWYAYHRTRMKAAKAGAGSAFAELNENMRVGFNTIWDRNAYNVPVGSDNGLFRDVGASTNKSTWFTRLYGAQGSARTPLHSALNRTGQYFQDTTGTGPWGPETGSDQVTCRQNFAILTTDGYWNEGQSGINEDNAPGPVHTSPTGSTGQYIPQRPYSDSYVGTLADMAMKYWKNDLRPTMANNVPSSTANPAFWQHMVTFGISIGLKGYLNPDSDLPNLTAGTTNSDGTTGWPNPRTDQTDDNPPWNVARIDDLWHASINGRGKFVAATSPDEFTQGLKDALAAVTERIGASSNVSVNGAKVGGGTQLFQSSFLSGPWTGEIAAYPVTASGPGATATWKASEQTPVESARKIFTSDGSTGRAFNWAGLSTAQQTALETPEPATTAQDVLAYLRGDTSQEIRNGGDFRDRRQLAGGRTHLLGDIDHSSPVYVDTDPDGNPLTNDGTRTVYAGANDGMLHAFDALTGTERFAYVPAGIDWSRLRTLSNKDYIHQYFVDGEIAVSTRTQTPGRNILVGVLGRGGKTVYALDVSTPDTFTAGNVLWEFTDPDMGNVLGQPIITKLNNGQTGVIIGNGYNSTSGRAVLFVLNIETGAVIKKFDTLAGDTTVAGANGMATPGGWDPNRSGTFDFIYAGDLLGNVWKFDISASATSAWGPSFGTTATPRPLFVAKDAGNKRQPITGGIAIGLHPATFERWIFFGTGRYLTTGDPANRDVQGWYGLMDNGTEIAGRGNLTERDVVLNTTAAGKTVRAFEEAVSGDMVGKRGWVVNLETPSAATEGGERIVTGNLFAGSVLLASSIIPSRDPCATGGRGYLNAIDPFTGASLDPPFFDIDGNGSLNAADKIGTGQAIGSVDLGIGMPSMPSLLRNGPSGKVQVVVGGSGDGSGLGSGSTIGGEQGILQGSWGRISWREVRRD